MTTAAPAALAPSPPLRIGEVAKQCGTTPRTIRYYEEIGLLGSSGDRVSGAHRTYTQQDVERLRDALRLRDLLGLSLDELKALLEAEEARAALRDEWHTGNPGSRRRRQILDESLGHLDRQLALVRRRREDIDRLEEELCARRKRVRSRLKEL
ncbi:MAG: MerR family transcriptional regulator [Solirubrobacteraceae bacterium]|nr:MerR family transcriptional regulator [Solirubrobacteraceae bacterium]